MTLFKFLEKVLGVENVHYSYRHCSFLCDYKGIEYEILYLNKDVKYWLKLTFINELSSIDELISNYRGSKLSIFRDEYTFDDIIKRPTFQIPHDELELEFELARLEE